MTNLTDNFAQNGDQLPLSPEQVLRGFDCGTFNRQTLNWMFYQITSQLAAPAATITGKNIAAGEIILTDSNGVSFNLLDVLRKAICDADPVPVGDTVLYDGAPAGRVNVPYLRGEGILIITCSWNYQRDLVTLILPIINGFPGQYEFTDHAEPFGPTGLVEKFEADFFTIVPREYYPHNAQIGNVGENGFITKIVYRRITQNPMCMALAPKPALSSFMAAKSGEPGPAGTPPAPPCVETALWSGNTGNNLNVNTITLSEPITRFGYLAISGFANGNFTMSLPATVGAEAEIDPNPADFNDTCWAKITSPTTVDVQFRNLDAMGAEDNNWTSVVGKCGAAP